MEIPVIDQFHDPSFKLLHGLIHAFPEAEGHIKTASIDESENAGRSSSAFAWPARRLFPIDSPEQAALSYLYMTKQASVPAVVRMECEKALRLYGVDIATGLTKTAAAPTREPYYLLPEIKRFEIRNQESIKLAAEAILTHQKQLDANSRAQACTRLVKKAMEHNVELPMGIYKMAGLTASHAPRLKDWLRARAEATVEPTIKKAYLKMAEALDRADGYITDREDLIKVAGVIGELDEAAGLTKFYDRSLPDPMNTVFNTDKISEETLTVAGKPVPMSTLLALPPEVYGDIFGDDLAAEFIQDGEVDPEMLKVILPTVPLDLQQALIANTGI